MIACGALGSSIREIARRRGWNIDVHNLSALLHDRPSRIAPAVENMVAKELAQGKRVAVAYADCGTYGALDEVCERLGVQRLSGLHCYDVFAGADKIEEIFSDEPGTYLLTDFLIQSFRKTVISELGLDRYPELVGDYFGHYRRVVWIAQRPSPKLADEAQSIAAMLGLPLVTIPTGGYGLELALESLIENSDLIGGKMRDGGDLLGEGEFAHAL